MVNNTQAIHWHHEVDVLVVGSGNGALTAAISAYDHGSRDVLIVEKADKFGGTSALSGGGVWVPNNRYAKAAGAEDSIDAAKTYLINTIPADQINEALINAYLEQAPAMVDFLHNNTRVRYESLEKYPDYYTDKEGAREGHRSMEPAEIALSELGDDMDNLLWSNTMYAMDKFAITQTEAHILVGKLKGWWQLLLKLAIKHFLDFSWRKNHNFSRRATTGIAGVTRLYLSVKDRNIPLWLNSPFKELLQEDNQVIGAIIEKEGQDFNIKTRKGVILAAGGFEHNQAMREQYLPKPTSTQWTAGCKGNTGDAINAAVSAGAQTRLMSGAWWCPSFILPNKEYPQLSITTKSMPGCITVNRSGLRFSNESQNYMAFIKDTFAKHREDNPCLPSWIIFDDSFKSRYRTFPLVMPNKMIPQEFFDCGFLTMADSIDELAEKSGIDITGLRQSVEKNNQFSETGKDTDFHRGDVAYDRYYGDPDVSPNPCLAKIQQAPFFALKMEAGDFGTQGGMVISPEAEVVNTQGEVIKGLYACGNCTAAVLPTYPGPGSTLGPAMTFGYVAGKSINRL
ncbi:MAG: FAD-binding protein [Pseudomonadales bacterium]|nr:FAD-binding protein [Pseudomonadales bacterium]